MYEQYVELRRQAAPALLLFRLGDFYELFGEDAVLAAPILEVALTSREVLPGQRLPMCGVPHHALATYLQRLLDAGHRVAIAEQMEDPALVRGLVRREIVRIVTPGTVTDPALLERTGDALLAAVAGTGLAVADASLGVVRVALLEGDLEQRGEQLVAELCRLAPRELLLDPAVPEPLRQRLRQALGDRASLVELAETEAGGDAPAVPWPDGIQPSDPDAAAAARLILRYLHRTLRSEFGPFRLELYRPSLFMGLDPTTQRNLELTTRLDGRSGPGTLLHVLDKTLTPMGKRLLRFWLLHPLLDLEAITARQQAVAELLAGPIFRGALRGALRRMADVQRLAQRAQAERATPRELWVLGRSLQAVPEVRTALDGCTSPLLRTTLQSVLPLPELVALLQQGLTDDPPSQLGQGSIIRPGFDPELDALRAAAGEGRNWLAQLEQQERERTGIRSLRIGYHRVFGYYIEVSTPNLALVPGDYQRKQTLAGGERFVTPALKELEQRILGAEEKAARREAALFGEIRQQVAAHGAALDRLAQAVAVLDVLASLAEVAAHRGWTMPAVDGSTDLVVRQGRHPVLEESLGPGRFVPNDVELVRPGRRLLLITGPNMAGKSTFMRQVALITLLAHIGSAVPASMARIGLCDRILTRIGASDDLAGGRSTFMVEMTEVADLLTRATERSLLLVDEVGRGTGTLDGLAIAWAVMEDIALRLKARTLFATHYHELTAVVSELAGVCNMHAAVSEQAEGIVFLHRIEEGPSDRSYGIAVATLAGVPPAVCRRAQELIGRLADPTEGARTDPEPAVPQPNAGWAELIQELAALQPLRMTPLEALQSLFSLQAKAERLWAEQLRQPGFRP